MTPIEFVRRIAHVTGNNSALGWCLSHPDGQIVSDEDIARAEAAGLVTVDRHTFSVGPVAFLTDAGVEASARKS